MTHKVFVYGTLKAGQGNHPALSARKSKFIGNAVSVSPLVVLDCGFPVVFDGPFYNFEQLQLIGELYEVSDECLASLDYLENDGVMYSRRMTTFRDDELQEHQAYMYFGCIEFWDKQRDLIECAITEKNGTRYYEWQP